MDDDYEQIIDFELTNEGFIEVPKVKNLKSVNHFSLLPVVKSEIPEVEERVFPKYKIDPNFGFGFCINIIKKNFCESFPIRAKYNKDKTDFSSTISVVSLEKIDRIYEDYQDVHLLEYLLKANGLDDKLQLSNLKFRNEAIQTFQEILSLREKYPIYTYDGRETLVRKHLSPISVAENSFELFFQVSENELIYTIKPKIRIGGKNLNITSNQLTITPLFLLYNEEMYPIPQAKMSFDLEQLLFNGGEINFVKKQTPDFFEKILKPITQGYEIEYNKLKKSKQKIVEETLEKHLYIADFNEDTVVFKPFVKYEEKLVPLYSKELIVKENTDKQTIEYIERNSAYEDNFSEEIKALHPDFEQQDHLFYLQVSQMMENFWFLSAVEKLKQSGVKVFGANELKNFRFNVNKPNISVKLDSGIDWFDIQLEVKFGNEKVSLKELQQAFIKQSNYVNLSDGTLGILPQDWMKKFAVYFKSGEIKKDSIQLSNYQFGIIDELYEELHQKPDFFEQLYQKKQRLLHLKEIKDVPVPKGIKAKLRHYQQEGLNWLAFLDENQLGGCLADDMGLGKTLQIITFLQYLKTTKKSKKPSLVVVPTSLVFNWISELQQFCPTLKVLPFVGAKRFDYKEELNSYEVIISTYGSLLNDVELYLNFN